MGILFDAVQSKDRGGVTPAMIRTGAVIGAALAVEPKIRQGTVNVVALDESTPITKEQYAYILDRAVRPGVYMREETVRPSRREK